MSEEEMPPPQHPQRQQEEDKAEEQQQNFPSVLLLRPLYGPFDEALSKKFRLLKPWEATSSSKDAFLAAHADSIRAVLSSGLSTVDAATIALLPRLRCVVATSAGLNQIDLDECRRRGIAVANAGTIYSDDTADYAVGLLIAVLRRIPAADRFVRGRLWPVDGEFPLGRKLGGKRIGIVGLGSIGSEIAKRLQAFGCIISYNSRTRKPHAPYAYYSSVHDLALESDVLILSCALTSETHHIVNKDVLSALGRHGVVINIGRGALIDEEELVRCLMQGEIGGAGLDVFENEPRVPQELFHMDNVVLSPHRAVLTRESYSDLLQLIMANLEAFFSNRSLITPVL